MVQLVCPACKSPLQGSADHLDCAGCGKQYPLRDGVPVFFKGEEFYEDYAAEHIPYVTNPPGLKGAILKVLPYYSWREWKFFRRHLRAGESVLDLGCGRGKEWFSAGASYIAGVDPCWSALSDCARHYDQVAQADMARLPFPDAAFDSVVTSHVLGHIPLESKDDALREVARVLKPGGKFINLIETDSQHEFVRYGKQDSGLYHLNFVETDGHVGLELPSAVLSRLQSHGFDIASLQKMESGIIHLRFYSKYLGKGYPERDPRIKRRIALWDRVQHNPLLLQLYEIGMGIYHHFVEPRLTPLDNAMFLCVCAVRRPV
ncbi:MAG TPA: methyltransferase domain-containing protein [Chloroflexota bacterium]